MTGTEIGRRRPILTTVHGLFVKRLQLQLQSVGGSEDEVLRNWVATAPRGDDDDCCAGADGVVAG